MRSHGDLHEHGDELEVGESSEPHFDPVRPAPPERHPRIHLELSASVTNAASGEAQVHHVVRLEMGNLLAVHPVRPSRLER